MDTPVLIAGAGPTGLTAALELARMGVPVRIVDKLPVRSAPSTPVVLQPRTAGLLDRRGVRLWALPRVYAVFEAAVYANGGLVGRIGLAADSKREPDLVLPTCDLVRSLREVLARHGVEVEHGTELVAVSQPRPDPPPDPGLAWVRAVLKRQDGRIEHMTTPYLIAAHGNRTPLPGLPESPTRRHHGGRGYVVTDLWLDGGLPDDEVSVLLGSHGFLTASPLGSGRFWCVATDSERSRSGQGSPTVPEIQQILDACSPIRVRIADVTFSARLPASRRVAPRLTHGRVFFGGAAAYSAQPPTAWRVSTGIQDMINLGWKLAMILRGSAVPDLIASYAPERREVLRQVRRADSAARVLGSRSGTVHQLVTRLASALFDSRVVLQRCADLVGEDLPSYRASPLSTPPYGSGSVQSGDAVPDVEVLSSPLDAGTADPLRVTSVRELVDPSRLTLLVAPDPTSARTPGWAELTSRWGDTLVAYTVAPRPDRPDEPGFVDAFGGGRGPILVRPDEYVAFSGGPRALPELERWLSRWFPPAPPADPGCGPDLAASRT